MATTVKELVSTTPYSKQLITFMKTRSDGRLPDKTKPTTPTDEKIHIGHIIGSSWYNLQHLHDHAEEVAFDYNRLHKEDPKYGAKLTSQTKAVINPILRKMNLKITEK